MRGKEMMERMTKVASRTGEPILKQPLLELCGQYRVLIEHHEGIGEYSPRAIHVKVRFGSIIVSGCCLEIARMTSDQMIITGNIDAVTLIKERGR